MHRLYLVTGGDVTDATPDTEWDGIESVLVAAPDERAALYAAVGYDAGRLGPTNYAIDGRTVACIVAD